MRLIYLFFLIMIICDSSYAENNLNQSKDKIRDSIESARVQLQRADIDFADISVLLNSGDDFFMPLSEYEKTGEMSSARKLEAMGIVFISIYQQIRGIPGPFVNIKPTEYGVYLIGVLRGKD